ncbi:8633_t:CDS:2, partial [Diversispora eburnea]
GSFADTGVYFLIILVFKTSHLFASTNVLLTLALALAMTKSSSEFDSLSIFHVLAIRKVSRVLISSNLSR